MPKPINDYFDNRPQNAKPDFLVTLDTLSRVSKNFADKVNESKWELLDGIADLSNEMKNDAKSTANNNITKYFGQVKQYIQELNLHVTNSQMLLVGESPDWKEKTKEFSNDFTKLKGAIGQTSLGNHQIVNFLERFETTLTKLGLLETSNGINK